MRSAQLPSLTDALVRGAQLLHSVRAHTFTLPLVSFYNWGKMLKRLFL